MIAETMMYGIIMDVNNQLLQIRFAGNTLPLKGTFEQAAMPLIHSIERMGISVEQIRKCLVWGSIPDGVWNLIPDRVWNLIPDR